MTQLRIARVDEHPIEPRIASRVRRQRVAEPPHAQERVLHRLFGIGPVAADHHRGAIGARVAIPDPVVQQVGPAGHRGYDARGRRLVRGFAAE